MQERQLTRPLRVCTLLKLAVILFPLASVLLSGKKEKEKKERKLFMICEMFVLQLHMRFMGLISGDEKGSEAEEDFSQSRKCHFSLIVYDSSSTFD